MWADLGRGSECKKQTVVMSKCGRSDMRGGMKVERELEMEMESCDADISALIV